MVTIYHNNRCSKSRKGLAYLEEKCASLEVKNYIKDGISPEEIKHILSVLDCSVKDIIRENEAEYKKHKKSNLSDEQWISLISDEPKLLQRPIVIKGNKGVIARPYDKIDTIL